MLLVMLVLALLVSPASASVIICNNTVDLTTGGPEFEVCFVHVEYNSNNTSTWTYTVTNLQTTTGSELSNWALELCDPAFSVVSPSTWITPGSFTHTVSPNPPDTHTGEAGATYDVTVSVNQALNKYGFPGIKYDATGNQIDIGETHIFQFDLLGHYAYTAGLELGVGTKDGGGNDVDKVVPGIGGPACPPTAVKLASFAAHSSALGEVSLTWETASEYDNAGFNVYRGRSPAGPFVKVNSSLIAAKGNATSGAVYSFVDAAGYGTFYYKLEDIDYFGASATHSPLEITMISPFRRPVFRPMYPGLAMVGIR
jgi:hypothetical protein